LTAALLGTVMATDLRQAMADLLYTVVLGGGSNPATVTVPDGYTGPVAVPNISASDITIASLELNPSLELVGSSPLHVGSVVPAQSTVAAGLNLTEADPAPVVPPGSAFAGLANISIDDKLGAFPINPIVAGGVTDPKGRTIVYYVTGLPLSAPFSTLTINGSTGVISGIYDAFGLEELFTVTVTARATGSAKSVSKIFVLTIINNG